MHLKRLRIVNYKAFEDFTFEPDASGLTALIGPNGSGKTSLWEVLSLISRLANGWQYEWLERQFAGRGRSFIGCLPWRDTSREMMFELEVQDDGNSYRYAIGWRAHPESGLPRLSTEELRWNNERVIWHDRRVERYRPSEKYRIRWHFLEKGYPILLSTVARQTLARTRLDKVKELFDWIATWGVFRFRVLDLMKDFNELALDRGPTDSITTTGDNLARMLYLWKTQPNTEALEAVSDAFSLVVRRSGYEGVSWDIKPEVAAGTVYLSVKLYWQDQPTKWHELAFGPDGFKSVLLLACALHSPCPLVVVEEPEVHLDPRLLDIVADLLVQAAKSGKQVVFTTHSPILAQHVPAECVRVLSRHSLLSVPEEVKASKQVMTAWLTDALHERAGHL